MDTRSEQRLGECYGLLEGTGDSELCERRFPDLVGEIRAYAQIQSALAELVPPPQPFSMASGRQALLSALARRQAPPLARRLSYASLGGALVAVTVTGLAVVGVSAATGHGIPYPVEHILTDVGVGSTTGGTGGGTQDYEADADQAADHGAAVADAVHDAQDATTPGPDRGEAVSEAACEAAHDRSTLPPGAGSAPGQQGQTPEVCPTQAGGILDATATPSVPAATPPAATPPGTGDAQATATPEGGAPPGIGNSNGGGPQNGKTPDPPNGKTPPGQQKPKPPEGE